MGITSPLQSVENTSNGNSIRDYDHVADPEDDGQDVRAFAQFIRATKAPPREELLAATADAQAGSDTFSRIGCDICHVRTMVTAPPGTSINGGAVMVQPALGSKVIRPFGDYLLHDIGTGDGIVQNGPISTRTKVRTAPLWGLRTRSRLMHDGTALTYVEAILRHQNEAGPATGAFQRLSPLERRQLLIFLKSL